MGEHKYIVGWRLTGETEVEASSPEQALKKLKRKMGHVYKQQPDWKISSLTPIFSVPAND
jgi:hypothetical protein